MAICSGRRHGTIREYIENMRQAHGVRAKLTAWGSMFLARLRRRQGCCGVPGAPGC